MDVDTTLIVTVNGSIAMKMETTMSMTMPMPVTLDSQVNMKVDITLE